MSSIKYISLSNTANLATELLVLDSPAPVVYIGTGDKNILNVSINNGPGLFQKYPLVEDSLDCRQALSGMVNFAFKLEVTDTRSQINFALNSSAYPLNNEDSLLVEFKQTNYYGYYPSIDENILEVTVPDSTYELIRPGSLLAEARLSSKSIQIIDYAAEVSESGTLIKSISLIWNRDCYSEFDLELEGEEITGLYGILPEGISFVDGVLQGVPVNSGVYTVNITTDSQSISLIISVPYLKRLL